jgi:beta-N-acetylhexosaminidase
VVIEPPPRDLTPADTTSWLPPGGLAAALAEVLPAVDGVVVDPAGAVADVTVLRSRAASADLVVLGTVDALADVATRDLARAVAGLGVPLVGVALRAPWDADAYPEIGTVLATYGIQPPSLVAAAAAIVGATPITGRSPVRLAGD